MESLHIKVRPMKLEDILDVVDIHCHGFIGSRSTKLGKPFLQKMYRWYLYHQSNFAFVTTLNKKPVGFVTGGFAGSSRKIFRYTLPEILFAFVRQPRLLLQSDMFEAWQNYAISLLSHHKPDSISSLHNLPPLERTTGQLIMKVTLDSISVSPEARGMSIGKLLVNAFEEAACRQGATYLSLGVEMDNMAARKLYESCGWILWKENPASNSANYFKDLVQPGK